MKDQDTNSRGLSEITAEILMIALILVLAMVIYILVFGNFNLDYMKKTVYVGATAEVMDIPRASGLTDHVLMFLPISGDKFYITGQNVDGTSGTRTTLKLESPDGRSIYPRTSTLTGDPYGEQIYIYPSNSGSATMCDYEASTILPSFNLRPMTIGVWKVQLIDEDLHVLADSYDTTMKYGTTSLPTAGGFISGMYRSDCTQYQQTFHGTLRNYTNGPGNMIYTYFDGSSYMTITNDPGLSTTGDMSLSIWIDPTAATGPLISSGSNWGNLLGKGSISSSGQENDNYQLVQMGNQIYFEWGDTGTGQHYNIVSSPGTLSNSNWNYVVVTTTNTGLPVIYVNGVAQSYTIYNSNTPGVNQIGTSSSPPAGWSGVKLQATTDPVSVGKQNSDTYPFYYTGGIGAVSLYNRALTPAEISQNYAGYLA
jgi:FlaG/FlaF family flagellin (archaellin)